GNYTPACGLGTWQGTTIRVTPYLAAILRNGYRLIDTAQLYGVEHVVGRAIRKSEVPRNEITVTTKFWGNHHHDVESAFNISLSLSAWFGLRRRLLNALAVGYNV
ncbi:putative reductase 1, partial [Colletotrichum gloeosporioides]